MEYFIQEYAVRSMLPHYATPGIQNFLQHAHGNIFSSRNNTEIFYGNSNNQYFISPSVQHLLNDSDYILDNDFNNTSPMEALASLAISTATTTLSNLRTSGTTKNNSLVRNDSDNGNGDSMNSIFRDAYADYLNISCDDESMGVVNAGNGTFEEEDASPLTSVYFKTAVYLLYIPIFIFALLGNGVVCYIITTPRMRTVTNYFIANLAVGDILMSLFCVPFSFVSIFLIRYWPFGIVLCYLVNYSQAVSVLVSAYTLVAISFDRYIAIMWPLRPRITKRYAKFIIAGVWSIALATAFPIPIVSKLTPPDEWHAQCHRYICREEWPTTEQSYYYSLALFTLQFVLPLAVLVFTYTRIALAVWGKRPPGEAENSRDQRMARSKRKMIKMMVMVVIVFTICWLPFNILILLLNDEEFSMWEPLPYFWFAFHWLAMSHSCYNPIIYCYMNARFRGGFLQIIYRVPGLRRCCCLRRYLRSRSDRNYEATGNDGAFHLQRVNTCTTYISTRKKLRTSSLQANQFSCAETTVLR